MRYTLGVDIGGTKVAAVIISESQEILYRAEVPSNPQDKEKMFKQVVKSIDMVLTESNLQVKDIEGMGVGVPGKVDRENGIAIYQNNLPWENFPIVKRLQESFSIENIIIDNDVYMAAFAEWTAANIKGEKTFVYVTVSTGVSCSIIHNGSFIRGAGFAGELGLFPVLSHSTSRGLNNLEKAASGPAIQKLAVQYFDDGDITLEDIFRKYQNGDSTAQILIQEVIDSLAHGIYSIICLLDPHKIVFGGGVMIHNSFLLDLVKTELRNYLIPEQQNILSRMEISHYKQNAGIIGAGLKGKE
ncbi:ROK family protein [Virgibacillus byunsanensis]|uniref:ROK family protein n=1 Tax=Virgibacillus byunsanensis TaxID=570945 RepID=A0ABW3LGR5_9BACI